MTTRRTFLKSSAAAVALPALAPAAVRPDTFTVALSHEERTPVAVPVGSSAFAEDTSAITLAWSRELEPGLSFSAAARAGTVDRDSRDQENFYSLQAGLAKVFSPSLAGTLQYQFSLRDGDDQGGRAVQNTVIVSLRQLF